MIHRTKKHEIKKNTNERRIWTNKHTSTLKKREMSELSSPRSSINILKNTRSKEWNECYFGKAVKVISPCVERLTLCAKKNEPVKVYRLKFNDIRLTKIKVIYI